MKRYGIVLLLFLAGSLAYAQPQSVSNLTALATSSEGEILLQWTSPDPGDGALAPAGYLVKYATSEIHSSDFYGTRVSTYSQNWSVLISSGFAESRVLTGLTCGATLYFAIAARDSVGTYGIWYSSADTGGAQNTVSYAVVLNVVPGQVEGLSAVRTNAAVDLSWAANTEPDILEYDVEMSSYSNTSGFSALVAILFPGTTHQQAGLVNGNTYYFRVLAKDITGNMGSYSVVKATMPWVSVGAPVFSSDAVALSSNTIRWAWGAVSNAQGYRVINSTSGNVLSGNLASNTTFWLQSVLTPNTSAAVYAQAFNGLITSDSSSKVIFTLCNPPTNFITSQGTSGVDISWPLNGNPSYTRYSVQRSSDISFIIFSWEMNLAVSTTHQDTGLEEGATYWYKVWATNNDNISVLPKIEFSTITARIAPSQPAINGTFSLPGSNDGYVNLAWSASYDDNGDAASGRCGAYVIKWATFTIDDSNFSNITSSSTVTATVDPPSSESVVITNLYPGTTYCFVLKARDEVNTYSVLSGTKAIYAMDLSPQGPSSLTALASSSSTVSLAWTLPSVSGYDDRDRYKIYRATFSFSSFTAGISTFSVTHPLTYYIDTGLSAETTYYYRVSSLDKGDAAGGYFSIVLESALSSIVYARTPDTTAPSAVTGISAITGDNEGRINLVWTSPGDDGASNPITGGKFRVDWSSNAQNNFQLSSYDTEITTNTSPGQQNTITVTGLSGGTTYYFRVWTADESGNWSAVSAGATSWAQVDITLPRVISGISCVPGWRRVSLSWISPGDDDNSGTLNGSYELRLSSVSAITGAASWNAVSSGYPYRIAWSTSTSPGASQSITVTGLTNSVTYYFSIRAADELGNWSIVSSTPSNALPYNRSPGSFALSSPSDNGISLVNRPVFAWNASSDADTSYGDSITYTLYYSTDSSFTPAITNSVSGISAVSYLVQQDLDEDKTYFWRARSTDADSASVLASSFSVRINTVNAAPGSFSLLSPPINAMRYTSTPVLSWGASQDQDPGDSISYRVDYSLTQDFSASTSYPGIASTSYTTPALVENATYWWRVWAIDNSSSARLCDTTFYFRVNASSEAPAAFNLLSPSSDSHQLSAGVTFYWESTSDPDPDDSVVYNLTYSLSPSFDVFASSTISGITASSVTVNLFWGDNYNYYWKVEAVGVRDGMGRYSNQARKLYVDAVKELPSDFILTDPPYNITISTTLRPLFSWDPSIDPDPADTVRYYIEISLNSDFSGAPAIPTGTDTFYQPLSNLLDQSTYYWRVRASGYQGSPASMVDPSYVFSPTGVFILSMTNSAPQAFELSSPANGSFVNTRLPTFKWLEAVDADFNEQVTYDVFIATTADFSNIVSSVVSSSSLESTILSQLSERKTYYWKVTARDRKGIQTPSISVYSFNVPVLSTASAPSGLYGAISSDGRSFTLYWSSVTRNIDATAINDLSGYYVYKILPMTSPGDAQLVAFIAGDSYTWTDSSAQGSKYFLRAVDDSGIESANSLVIDSLNPEGLTLMYMDSSGSQTEVEAELPAAVSRELLAANNKWQKDLTLDVARKKDMEVGRIIGVYEIGVKDSSLNAVTGYEFSSPLILQFYYSFIIGAPSLAAPGQSSDSYAVFWYNGIEYIRMASYYEEGRSVWVKAARPGIYQLRRVSRAYGFGLASIYPNKVFTPGIAPYDKILFYVDNPSGDKVTGNIFDMRGEQAAQMRPMGDATDTTVILSWDGKDAPAGVYIYQIESDSKLISGTVVVAR